MKRWILVLCLATCILVSGCAYNMTNKPKSYWIKDGKEVPSEQAQRDYQKCRGPEWTKDEVTTTEIEKDYDFCVEASAARAKHQRVAANVLSLGAIIPFVNIATGIAMVAVQAGGSLSVQRCMESKGYRETVPSGETEQCMKEKGYEWIEEK